MRVNLAQLRPSLADPHLALFSYQRKRKKKTETEKKKKEKSKTKKIKLLKLFTKALVCRLRWSVPTELPKTTSINCENV